MIKKFLFLVAVFVMSTGFAFAQADASKADQAALDGIKGVGPKMSKAILAERKKGGEFKDWADFEKRVKGIKEKSARKLSEHGLTVNGQSRPGSPAKQGAHAKGADKSKGLQMVSGADPENGSKPTKVRGRPFPHKAADAASSTK
ncbi:MAG: comEA [Herminiimonas sp.]|nr:comEA [Herminiimonas sp.]MDB5853834.1 comEA [Herminiimonas sp.]